MEKNEVIQKMCIDFSYTQNELKEWEFIEVESRPDMFGNVFFDGNYVFFAEDKIVWY